MEAEQSLRRNHHLRPLGSRRSSQSGNATGNSTYCRANATARDRTDRRAQRSAARRVRSRVAAFARTFTRPCISSQRISLATKIDGGNLQLQSWLPRQIAGFLNPCNLPGQHRTARNRQDIALIHIAGNRSLEERAHLRLARIQRLAGPHIQQRTRRNRNRPARLLINRLRRIVLLRRVVGLLRISGRLRLSRRIALLVLSLIGVGNALIIRRRRWHRLVGLLISNRRMLRRSVVHLKIVLNRANTAHTSRNLLGKLLGGVVAYRPGKGNVALNRGGGNTLPLQLRRLR